MYVRDDMEAKYWRKKKKSNKVPHFTEKNMDNI